MDAKAQYIHTIVRGEALHQFDTLSAEVESTNTLTLEAIILVSGTYFPPVNYLSKKKRAINHITRKPRGLKVRRSADRFIDLNDYLDFFPWGKTD